MKTSIFALALAGLLSSASMTAKAFTVVEATMIKGGLTLAATPHQPAKVSDNLIVRLSGGRPGDHVYFGEVISHTGYYGEFGKIAADGTFSFNLANFNATTGYNAELFVTQYCTLAITAAYNLSTSKTANLAGCGRGAPIPVQGALPKVTAVDLTTITVSWTSSTAASANLLYMLDSTSSNPIKSIKMSKKGTTFSAKITGLTQETWYRLGVSAVDSSGRQVGYGDLANGIGVLIRTSAPKPPCYCTRPR
jgi:hypothetical protein